MPVKSNISFTRISELTEGTPVSDSNGKVYGLSKTAGFTGISQSALTRCILVPCACLMLPPAAKHLMKRVNFFPKNKKVQLLVELGLIYFSIQAALPAALAVYPQQIEIPVSRLEEKFRHLLDESGKPINVLYANKGL